MRTVWIACRVRWVGSAMAMMDALEERLIESAQSAALWDFGLSAISQGKRASINGTGSVLGVVG